MTDWFVPEGAYALVARTNDGRKIMLVVEGGVDRREMDAFGAALKIINSETTA